MKIKELKITNFRCLEAIAFNPGSHVSVIAGPSAVGKSTIFQETFQDMRAWSPFGSSINFDALIGDKDAGCETSVPQPDKTGRSKLLCHGRFGSQNTSANARAVKQN